MVWSLLCMQTSPPLLYPYSLTSFCSSSHHSWSLSSYLLNSSNPFCLITPPHLLSHLACQAHYSWYLFSLFTPLFPIISLQAPSPPFAPSSWLQLVPSPKTLSTPPSSPSHPSPSRRRWWRLLGWRWHPSGKPALLEIEGRLGSFGLMDLGSLFNLMNNGDGGRLGFF